MAENRIPLKTDERHYDQDDFIQTECGTLKELTVTITLHEYRQLVKDISYWASKAQDAQAELRRIRTKQLMETEEKWIKENPDA